MRNKKLQDKPLITQRIFMEQNYVFRILHYNYNSVWLSCIIRISFQNSDFWYCNTPFFMTEKHTDYVTLQWNSCPNIYLSFVRVLFILFGYYLCVIIKNKKIHSKIFHYFHDNRNKLLVNYRKLYNKLVSKTLRNKLRNAEYGKVSQIADYFTDGNRMIRDRNEYFNEWLNTSQFDKKHEIASIKWYDILKQINSTNKHSFALD